MSSVKIHLKAGTSHDDYDRLRKVLLNLHDVTTAACHTTVKP
jgi:hypothetical protein